MLFLYSSLTFSANSDTFSSLQPTYFPGFAFSWMSLISHRLFMPKLLLSDNREVRLVIILTIHPG